MDKKKPRQATFYRHVNVRIPPDFGAVFDRFKQDETGRSDAGALLYLAKLGLYASYEHHLLIAWDRPPRIEKAPDQS